MEHVWVIEQGQYSDYHVVGVYDSEEKAKAVANVLDKGWRDEPIVSKWPLNPGFEEINQGLWKYFVVMNVNGNVENINRCKDMSGFNLTQSDHIVRDGDFIHCSVWAKDEEHAIKIVAEKRAEMLATGQWYDRR